MTRDYNPEIDDANQQAQDHGAPFVPSVPSYLLLSHEVEKLKEILSRARTVICDLLETMDWVVSRRAPTPSWRPLRVTWRRRTRRQATGRVRLWASLDFFYATLYTSVSL
jgi:hypothetical protein